MARYTGAKCKLCRREGEKLYLRGDRCYSNKCAVERRKSAPGQHGKRRVKMTGYGIQLREKQKAKRIYGVLEKQFRNYFKKADRKTGVTGENLLQMLELRLDNIVYRLGFAPSRNAARQLVKHGHFLVNGKKVDIPSYQVSVNDVVTVKEKSKGIAMLQETVETRGLDNSIAWLALDKNKLEGKVVAVPTRDEIPENITERLIVELYSK
jgi:small subunit ribosomal protein S4